MEGTVACGTEGMRWGREEGPFGSPIDPLQFHVWGCGCVWESAALAGRGSAVPLTCAVCQCLGCKCPRHHQLQATSVPASWPGRDVLTSWSELVMPLLPLPPPPSAHPGVAHAACGSAQLPVRPGSAHCLNAFGWACTGRGWLVRPLGGWGHRALPSSDSWTPGLLV